MPEMGLSRPSDFEKRLMLKNISRMANIPIPSNHELEVIALLQKEEVDVADFIAAIEDDENLHGKILLLANSGNYDIDFLASSFGDVLEYLDILTVKQIIYSACVREIFPDNEKAEWNHAYSCSMLMNNLMIQNEQVAAGNLQFAMLVHDIGKVVLGMLNPRRYKQAVEKSILDNIPISLTEESIVKINHAEAGGLVLKRWGDIPEDVIRSVFSHHQDSLPPDHVLETAMVQLVDWVDSMARDEVCVRPTDELMNAAGFQGLDTDYIVRYQRELIRSIEGSEAVRVNSDSYNLDLTSAPDIFSEPEPEYEPEPEPEIETTSTIVFKRPTKIEKPAPPPPPPEEEPNVDTGTVVFKRPSGVKRAGVPRIKLKK